MKFESKRGVKDNSWGTLSSQEETVEEILFFS
jgi:hypothetical protein